MLAHIKERENENPMRLVIQRSQNEVRGMMGGSKGFKFSLTCQLQLTRDELDMGLLHE